MMPTTLETSSDYAEISFPPQRASFHAAGRLWVFYYWTGGYYFKSSTDGITWSARSANLGAATRAYRHSIWWDGTYVNSSRTVASGAVIYYRRGIPNADGTITWDPERTAYTDAHVFSYNNIAKDTLGYPWLAWSENDGGLKVYAGRASNDSGTAWAARTALDLTAGTIQPTIVPLPSEKMYVVWAYYTPAEGSRTLRGKLYDGAAWAGGYTTIVSNVNNYTCYSLVSVGSTVFLVYTEGTTHDLYFKTYTEAGGWSAATKIEDTLADDATAPTLTIKDNQLYVFWIYNGRVYSKVYSNGSWGITTQWINDIISAISNITSDYEADTDHLSVLWCKDAANVLRHEFYTASSASLSAEFIVTRPGSVALKGIVILNQSNGSVFLRAEFVVNQLNGMNILPAEFIVTRPGTADLQAEFTVRHSASTDLKAILIINQISDFTEIRTKFFVHKTYDLTGALGVGFYWWGSGVAQGDQNIEFQLISPTGGWIAKYPDGDPEWKWVLLPFEDRDPTSNLRLMEVDLGGSRANKAEIETFLWTYFSEGVRRLAYLCIWYGGDLKAEFTVRQPGAADLLAEFVVRHSVSSDLKAVLGIAHWEDLNAEFYITPHGEANLKGVFIVPLPRVDLIAEQTLLAVQQSVTFDDLDLTTHKFYRLVVSLENADAVNGASVWMYMNDDEDRTHYLGSVSALMAAPITSLVSTYNSPLVASVSINERATMDILIMRTPSGIVTYLGEFSTPVAGYGYTTDIARKVAGQSNFTVANLTKIKLIAMQTNVIVGVGFKIGSKFQLYGYKDV